MQRYFATRCIHMSPPKMSNSHVWFSAFKPPIKRLDRVMWSMCVPFFSQMIWPSSASACVNCLHTNVPNKSADLEWYHKHWSHTRSVITFTKEETVVYLVPLAKSRKCIFLDIKKKISLWFKLVETDFWLCKSCFARYFEQLVLALILNNDIFFTKK